MPNKYRELFIGETEELLTSFNRALVKLEKKPQNADLLNEIFRFAHTIKGMADSEGQAEISELVDGVEDILSAIREGKIQIKPKLMDLLFSSCDMLDSLLAEVKKKKGHKLDINPSIDKLKEYLKKEKALPKKVEKRGFRKDKIELEKVKAIQSVRIDVSKLDRLMNLAGELAIERSRLSDIVKETESPEAKEAFSNIERLVGQLQDLTTETRLVPLAIVFERFPRMVRDIAKEEEKEVQFDMKGTGIELDRTILDGITDPLVHLLRNALTHGIELPAERKRAGKSPKGIVNLSARREKNKVIIEVSDDGRGIDLDQVHRLAKNMKILREEELKKLPDEQLLFLITYPGLTTVSKAKGVSGRGVGMDVVRRTVESFGGRLSIASKVGEGSAFAVELPLSLAIIQALLVGVQDHKFAIPLINILETIRLEKQKIKLMEKQEIFNLRGEVVPIFHLDALLEMKTSRVSKKKEELICVMEVGFRKAGIAVDSFLSQQDIVVKSIPPFLGHLKGISGLTLLSDGHPCTILDVAGLV